MHHFQHLDKFKDCRTWTQVCQRKKELRSQKESLEAAVELEKSEPLSVSSPDTNMHLSAGTMAEDDDNEKVTTKSTINNF